VTEATITPSHPPLLPYPHSCPADGDPFVASRPPMPRGAPSPIDGVGVLLTAYGGPSSLDEVPAYYTDIRGGRPPSPALLEELLQRYQAIGGRSPLPAITEAQRRGLAEELAQRRLPLPVFVGYKHSAPTVADAVAEATRAGLRHLVVVPLAPHFSVMTSCTYCQRVDAARRDRGPSFPLTYTMVADWHDESAFVAALSRRVAAAIADWPLDQRESATPIHVLFSAHSLPERITAQGDPYPQLLRETARLVADHLGLTAWSFAFQSAGRTDEPWLGPDLLTQLDALATQGVRRVLVASVGFVTTNLELLYDIDIEARTHAAGLGMELRRVPALDDDPGLVAALADLVQRAVTGEPAASRPSASMDEPASVKERAAAPSSESA
jgi:ferrochelatase